jgi:hypothetical protein
MKKKTKNSKKKIKDQRPVLPFIELSLSKQKTKTNMAKSASFFCTSDWNRPITNTRYVFNATSQACLSYSCQDALFHILPASRRLAVGGFKMRVSQLRWR